MTTTLIIIIVLKMMKSVPEPERDSVPIKVPSAALLGPRKELVITHNGREYRLRVTQNGKLILTA